jgi:hypothetical protein
MASDGHELHPSSQVNDRAASTLSELARNNPANQSSDAQAGGIAPYVALLQGTCMTRESRGWPLCTRLACIAHHSAPLRSCPKGDGAESAKKAAASALWSFSAIDHAQNQAVIEEAGGLAPLVVSLGVGGAETELQAARALTAIALDNPQNQSTIATMLVRLLTAPDTPRRTSAYRMISNLAQAHTSNQEAFTK